MTRKGLAWFTLFTLAALALLIGLGVWQLKRLAWKEGLIAEIEARAKGTPITLQEAIGLARTGKDPSYYRVHVKGRFDNDKERYLYALSTEGEPGWHVIAPFSTVEGDLVLIDRGFVPDHLREPSTRAAGQLDGDVDVTGLVRLPETQGLFTPDNDPNANQWFWRDLSGHDFFDVPHGNHGPCAVLPRSREKRHTGGLARGGADPSRTPQ